MEYYNVDPNKIEVEPDWNVRTNFEIDDLIESIKENGIITPIHLVKRMSDGKLVLRNGERRLRAVLEANKQGAAIGKIPALIYKKGLTDEESLALQFTANDGEPWTPLEEAEICKRFRNWGWTQEQTAKKLGKSQAFVSQRLELVKLTPEAQQALEDKKITLQQARAVAKNPSVDAQKAATKAATKKKKRPQKTKEGLSIIYVDEHTECDLGGLADLIKIEIMKPIKDAEMLGAHLDELEDLITEIRLNPTEYSFAEDYYIAVE
jgi:ParB family chromosome partitioning protein